MGCGNIREELEDKIMTIKLKMTELQLEREKTLQKLSELEGYPINIDNYSEYLSSNKTKILENKKNLVDNNVNNDITNENFFKDNNILIFKQINIPPNELKLNENNNYRENIDISEIKENNSLSGNYNNEKSNMSLYLDKFNKRSLKKNNSALMKLNFTKNKINKMIKIKNINI